MREAGPDDAALLHWLSCVPAQVGPNEVRKQKSIVKIKKCRCGCQSSTGGEAAVLGSYLRVTDTNQSAVEDQRDV